MTARRIHLRIRTPSPCYGTIVPGIALVAFLVGNMAAGGVFEQVPHLEDEVANLFRAKVFALGKMCIPSPWYPPSFFAPFVLAPEYVCLVSAGAYPLLDQRLHLWPALLLRGPARPVAAHRAGGAGCRPATMALYPDRTVFSLKNKTRLHSGPGGLTFFAAWTGVASLFRRGPFAIRPDQQKSS